MASLLCRAQTAHRAVATTDRFEFGWPIGCRPGWFLRAVDRHDLALEGPIFRGSFKPGNSGIIPYILPFLAHALIGAQQVIERALLPDLPVAQAPVSAPCEELFQAPDPRAGLKSRSPRHEKMNVIRHDYITSDGNTKAVTSSFSEGAKGFVNGRRRQPSLALVGHECDQIDRLLEGLERNNSRRPFLKS
jgi:hypothetical protein